MRYRQALVVSGLLLVVLAATVAGAQSLYERVGRTPGEIIDHVQLQLRNSNFAGLEAALGPVLETASKWLVEPGPAEWAAPFVVPPLPPNPALTAQPGPQTASGSAPDATPTDSAKVIRVGPERAITSLAQASTLAGDGSIIEIDPGDYHADVAVWDRAELTLRAAGPGVRLIASGRHAEGKAIWVIRRGKVVVEGIDFIGARVPDRNGAGIRLEAGHLVVRRCAFIDNESGILSTGDPAARLEVENSEFGYNGAGDGLSHGIYAGPIAYLRVSGSYFHHANVGHLIKSRAKVNRIEYNRITDESGGRASYELEFPNGGVADVVGNIIQQGQETRNSVMVSYGAEGYSWPHNRLRMAYNTLVNDRQYGGTFLRAAEGAVSVETRDNLLSGRGIVDLPPGAASSGDHRVAWKDFERAARGDYRLTAKSARRLAAQPAIAGSPDMLPAFQYVHPLQTRALPQGPRFAGAAQGP